jgi:hypothetical protein
MTTPAVSFVAKSGTGKFRGLQPLVNLRKKLFYGF